MALHVIQTDTYTFIFGDDMLEEINKRMEELIEERYGK